MRAWISSGLLTVGSSFLKGRRRAVALTALVALGTGTLGGCTGRVPYSGPVAPVDITDFRTVAGRWTGWLTAEGRPRQDDDQVDVTIAENGAYAFAVARNVGPFVGKGQFVLKDGKLVMDGERGRATFTLLRAANGGRQMRGDAVRDSGAPVWVDLLPAQ